MYALFVTNGLTIAFLCFIAGAVSSLIIENLFGERHLAARSTHALAALGASFALVFGLTHLVATTGTVLSLPVAIGLSGQIVSLYIDPLAALFITAIATVALAASIYGLGYQTQYIDTYRQGGFGFFYNSFIASMLLVVTANNALLFLFAWEAMALASYFLVVFEREHAKNVTAGTLYVLMTQLGTVFIFGAFLILYHFAGSWDFTAMRAAASTMPPLFVHLTLAAALIGFGTKAGIIPLHIWLPDAHPAAPSHVSALMSGVMIKTAIFMIIRFSIGLFPAHMLLTWGLIILILGAVSSLLGVLYALTAHDIKRLLAFHSVENIGIILLGLGAAITFFALQLPLLGALALIASLYHTINHAVFKALLFLSAGSVVHATGTRNMEAYGGLIKRMPWTAVFFLMGAVAISGLPPFNGFVSEWLTFQALFAGITTLPIVPKLVFILSMASLAFTGGLAAACFVKAFGVTFLARPRSAAPERAHESPLSMRIGMALLATLTVVLGLGASVVAPILNHIEAFLRDQRLANTTPATPHAIQIGATTQLSMLALGLAFAVALAVTYGVTRIWSRRQRVVINRTWDCGAPLTPRMEITATGFARSILVVFRGLIRPQLHVAITTGTASAPYATRRIAVEQHVPDLYRLYVYHPLLSAYEWSARWVRKIHSGNLNAYLAYMFLTVIVLLLWTLSA